MEKQINMHSEKFPAEIFPLCQHVCCSKNCLSDKKFWKKEIESQYQFYLAALRAERDVKYLMKEHSDILRCLEDAEARNVKLRQEIRVLETEIYIICQRNAHDSPVIDGLHEADYVAGEIQHLEGESRKRIDIVSAEGDHEDRIAKMLKEEIDLLERKDGEDAELIASLEPLEKQLKQTLQEEKLKNHQQASKFKRDLEEILKTIRDRIPELEAISTEKSSATLWTMEMYHSLFGEEKVNHQDNSDAGTSSPESSNQEADSFDVSSQLDTVTDDWCEDLQQMKQSYSEYVARKELLDAKNVVTMELIHDDLQQFADGLRLLGEEYVAVYKVWTEIEFIREYLQRLDVMRKNKDIVCDETSIKAAHRVDQLNLFYNSLLSDKMYLEKMLKYFTSTLREDFEAHCVTLLKTEELFTKSEVQTDIYDRID